MKTIKEQLKGTCVLNEKEGMGAEIVALYKGSRKSKVNPEPGVIDFLKYFYYFLAILK